MSPAKVAHIMALVQQHAAACLNGLPTTHKLFEQIEAALLAPQQAEGWVMVDRGALHMVINALRRDAEEGRSVRGEMADMLLETPSAPTAVEPDEREPKFCLYCGELVTEPCFDGYCPQRASKGTK